MVKKTTLIIGGLLIIFGILGFLPNPVVGLRAFFITDIFHNILHLLAGFGLVLMGFKSDSAGITAQKVFGVCFTILAIVGFFSSQQKLIGLVNMNSADNWLHFFLGGLLLFYSQKYSKKY